MDRIQFIKSVLGTSLLISIDGMNTFSNTIRLQMPEKKTNVDELASFGAVHLNNTSLQKASFFWTTIIGLKIRNESPAMIEFGTETRTLVVVHETAQSSFQEGYSGLYHFAIHLANKEELAKAIYRLQQHHYSFSPIDHTMTQSLYLTDNDNVMVELALESPERFKRVITEGGLFMEDTDGTIRGASAPLDVEEVLKSLLDKDLEKRLSNDSKIGHLHFYAKDVALNNSFYQKMGFTSFNFFPQYQYADLGAGGAYQHRLAMNSWHGHNKPLAPKSYAGLKHYSIVFKSKADLQRAISNIDTIEEQDGSYWTNDPTGIRIVLSSEV